MFLFGEEKEQAKWGTSRVQVGYKYNTSRIQAKSGELRVKSGEWKEIQKLMKIAEKEEWREEKKEEKNKIKKHKDMDLEEILKIIVVMIISLAEIIFAIWIIVSMFMSVC